MLRWLIVCALLAQTLVLARPNRRYGANHRQTDIGTNRGRPDIDQIPDRHEPQRGSSNRRGQWSNLPQIDQHRPTQTGTQQPAKPRKQRPQPREGPPQRRELVRADRKSLKMPSSYRQSVPHIEPSVIQQVDEFRSGMPQDMQEQLRGTFESIKRKLGQGSLMMDSWADDINAAVEEWTDSTNTDFRPRDPTYNPPRNYNPQRPNGRGGSRYSPQRPNGRGGSRYNPYRPNGRGESQYNPYRPDGRGESQYNPYRPDGRDESQYNPYRPNGRGESRNPSDGQWNGGSGRWNTECERPFRPPTEEPSREEPEYDVLCAGNDYEARMYNSSVWVSVTIKTMTCDVAQIRAFKKLFKYINGNNMAGSMIPMTIPVRSRVKTNSKERRWSERHNYTISFYVPKDLHGNPPIPNDPELFIEYEAPTVYYAHTFRGYALEFNIWEYLEELTNTLDVSQESYKMEDFLVNVYDEPWKLFNRRNDILVAMDTELQNTPRCKVPTPEMPEVPEMPTEAPVPEVPTEAPVPEVPTEAPVPEVPTEAPREVQTKAPTEAPTTDGELLPVPAEIMNRFQRLQRPVENNVMEQPSSVRCEPGSECPRYSTSVMYNGFELRHYDNSRWICVDWNGCDVETVQVFTQRMLLEYFKPEGNREQITMSPTTPLVIGLDIADLNDTNCRKVYTSCVVFPDEHMRAPQKPRNIKSDVADSLYTDCSKVYTSCMYIPEEHQTAPPTPRDAKLYFVDIPAMSRYVKPFSGSLSSQNVPKHGVKFLKQLERSKQSYDGSILAVAQYATSRKAKTRVNELWVMDQTLTRA